MADDHNIKRIPTTILLDEDQPDILMQTYTSESLQAVQLQPIEKLLLRSEL